VASSFFRVALRNKFETRNPNEIRSPNEEKPHAERLC
jgi:hypothetical protein